MIKNKKITIKQAVINVCERMAPGEELLGYQFCDRVQNELWINGSRARPLSGTILRAYRSVRDQCSMESKHAVSKYRKKLTTDN